MFSLAPGIGGLFHRVPWQQTVSPFPAALPARGAPVPRAQPLLSRRGYVLFLAAAAYLVTPLLDVPLWGISWSTPALLLVAGEVFPAASRSTVAGLLRVGSRWAACCGAGQFLSLLGNVFAGEIAAVSSTDLAWLLRDGLWMTVFRPDGGARFPASD